MSAIASRSRTVAAVPMYFRYFPDECCWQRAPSSSYFRCMRSAWASRASVSDESVKFAVASMPVSSMVPAQNALYSASSSKQATFPGLQRRSARSLRLSNQREGAYTDKVPTPRGSQLTMS